LTAAEREALAAALDRILPSEAGFGAADSNAIGFIDWLATRQRFAATMSTLRNGVPLLDAIAEGTWQKPFVDCSPEERDAVLVRVQQTPHPSPQNFLRALVRVALAGSFCAPEYGGNRRETGWAFTGFQPHPLTFVTRGTNA
jgi:hypothetical protein